ncbi:hypothetical protein ACP4J4_17250 [Aureimonas ureilytica]|uniref:hypothetical protein n=1 Tax=Aureimonas ureilytica TaxID=401562 RepID=UPI003CE822B7
MTRVDLAFHMAGHVSDSGDVGDGGAAEFENETRHETIVPAWAGIANEGAGQTQDKETPAGGVFP